MILVLSFVLLISSGSSALAVSGGRMSNELDTEITVQEPACQVTVSASPPEGGTVSGTGSYAVGEEITVQATAVSGYEFDKWTEGDTEVSSDAEYSFALEENRNLVANFREVEDRPTGPPAPSPETPREVEIGVQGEGSVEPEPGIHTYDDGEAVTLEAEPAEGWLFSNWLVDDESIGEDSRLTITVEDNLSVTAVFVKPGVVAPSVGGRITPKEGGTVEIPGMISITLAPYAADQPIDLTISTRDAFEDPDMANLMDEGRQPIDGIVYEISAVSIEDGEEVTSFSSPLLITFSPKEEEGEQENLVAHYYNADLGAWIAIPTIQDPETGEVSVEVTHLSQFALFPYERMEDVVGHWAEADILKLVSIGAISGYDDYSFRPDETVTREQFAKMLAEAANLNVPAQSRTLPYLVDDADEVSEWARPYVERVLSEGFLRGYEDGTFRPKDEVTRVQVATILGRSLRLVPEGGPDYMDTDEIPDWGRGYVAALAHYDIVRGYPADGLEFRPHRATTRAEGAAFLSRYLDVSSNR
ncbi:MAG: S-layer homology domain-containing protein [Clostridia bacterium]